MITLCAVLGSYEDWVSIEDFGCGNETWLVVFWRAQLRPSHDTLSDVIWHIDRDAFAQAFGA
jgi:hypothetical protein